MAKSNLEMEISKSIFWAGGEQAFAPEKVQQTVAKLVRELSVRFNFGIPPELIIDSIVTYVRVNYNLELAGLNIDDELKPISDQYDYLTNIAYLLTRTFVTPQSLDNALLDFAVKRSEHVMRGDSAKNVRTVLAGQIMFAANEAKLVYNELVETGKLEPSNAMADYLEEFASDKTKALELADQSLGSAV